ncbi:hypothetical protein NDU88_004181 [Pleurodeles waltl]|uniref:Uncharacterized protein n=1 Tax=Pleurodeles waltl TaxID=8319 RepID=A0AAV7T7M4_PLEWA|nr:hypothetical protein NDU88_004181 [Pleurodeles waltl]
MDSREYDTDDKGEGKGRVGFSLSLKRKSPGKEEEDHWSAPLICTHDGDDVCGEKIVVKRHAKTSCNASKVLVLLTYDEIRSDEILIFQVKQENSSAEVLPQVSLIVEEALMKKVKEEPEGVVKAEEV